MIMAGEVGQVGLGLLSGLLNGITQRQQRKRQDKQRAEEISFRQQQLDLQREPIEAARQARISEEAAAPGLLKGQEARQQAGENIQQRFAERGITSGPDLARLRTARGLEDIKTGGALTREAGKRFAQPGGRTPADMTFAKETKAVSSLRNAIKNNMGDEFDVIERRIGPGPIEEAIRNSLRSQGTAKAERPEETIRQSFAKVWAEDIFNESAQDFIEKGAATTSSSFASGDELNDVPTNPGIVFDEIKTNYDLEDIAVIFVQNRKSEPEFQEFIDEVMNQKFQAQGGGSRSSGFGGFMKSVFGGGQNEEGLTNRELGLIRGIASGFGKSAASFEEEKAVLMQKLLAKEASGTLNEDERRFIVSNPQIVAKVRGIEGTGPFGASQIKRTGGIGGGQ